MTSPQLSTTANPAPTKRGMANAQCSATDRSGIPIVEHLTDLARLMGRAFRSFAVPVPVRGLGAFPVRLSSCWNRRRWSQFG